MSITKKVLYDHFEGKFKQAEVAMGERIRKQIETVYGNLRYVLQMNLPLAAVEKMAKELREEMNMLIGDYSTLFDDYSFRNTVTYMSSWTKATSEVVEEIESRLIAVVEKYPSKTMAIYGIDTIDCHKDIWLAFAKSISEEKKNLKTLHEEIKQVIKDASSAKAAIKRLKELGVELEEDKVAPITPMLPAIVKFSVDPCMINAGGCN